MQNDVTATGIKPGVRKRAFNGRDAFSLGAIPLPENEFMDFVQVQHVAIGIEHGRNATPPPQHTISAETRFKGIEVTHAVQHRKNRRFGTNRWRERANCIVQVVRFATEQDHVVRTVQRSRRYHGQRLHTNVTVRTLDNQPCALKRSGTSRAHKKGHVPPDVEQSATKVAANAPCSDHQNSHASDPLK